MARYQLDGTKVIDRRRNEVARFMLEETARSACHRLNDGDRAQFFWELIKDADGE